MLTALAAALALAPATADARTDNRTKAVYFVHGLDRSDAPGNNCKTTFDVNDDGTDAMTRRFRDWGYTGEFERVAYYLNDSNCDHSINHHGNHSTHYSQPAHENERSHFSDGSQTADTNIRHLGYHLAWDIWSHYTSEGKTVDVVAHSMGGLITRYALAQTELNNPDFPPSLKVEDVVTLGTPHGGARWYAIGCSFNQCDQMNAGSDFLVWLENNAWEPDGEGGTDWTTMGSDDDNAVAADRAAGTARDRDPVSDYIGSCHKVWYWSTMNLEHSDYMHETSTTTNADVYRRNCPNAFVSDTTSQWPVKRTDLALTYGTH